MNRSPQAPDKSSSQIEVATCDEEEEATNRFPRQQSSRFWMPKGGVIATCCSWAAGSLGAGVLGLPSAFKSAGVLLGTVMLLLTCAATVYSIRLLVLVNERTGFNTYESIAGGLYGKRMERLTAAIIVTFCWGCSVAYVVAIGDMVRKLNVSSSADVAATAALSKISGSNLFSIDSSSAVLVIYWAVLLMPLSLPKEINFLRYMSTFGVFACLFLGACVIMHAVEAGAERAKENLTFSMNFLDANTFVAMPIFIFSYCNQALTFEIYAEMKPKNVSTMTVRAGMAMLLCTAIYLSVGIAGFANFGAETNGNILNNLDPGSSSYVALAFLSTTVSLTAIFPLFMFPTRNAILQSIGGYPSSSAAPARVRMGISFGLATASLICGIAAPGIKVLFGVLGGVCGASLAFILPALFFLKTTTGTTGSSSSSIDIFMSKALVLVGIFAGGLGTLVSLLQTFKEN